MHEPLAREADSALSTQAISSRGRQRFCMLVYGQC
jgi:hypothetical protein